MKKHFLCILACLILLIGGTVSAKDLSIYFNDDKMTFESEPYIENERTMVPFRTIFEAADAAVLWDEETRTIIAFKTVGEETTSIAFQADENYAFVNNEKVEIDAPAKIKNGLTFVPLRFIMETLSADVKWDGDTYTVFVSMN